MVPSGDTDSNGAMPTAPEASTTQTVRNTGPSFFSPFSLLVVRNWSWKCQSEGNFTLRFAWQETLRFMCPSCTRDTDGIAAKLLRCGIASEALRRNMPLSWKSLANGDFIRYVYWRNWSPLRKFLAISRLWWKIASEWGCAIWVHSGLNRIPERHTTKLGVVLPALLWSRNLCVFVLGDPSKWPWRFRPEGGAKQTQQDVRQNIKRRWGCLRIGERRACEAKIRPSGENDPFAHVLLLCLMPQGRVVVK